MHGQPNYNPQPQQPQPQNQNYNSGQPNQSKIQKVMNATIVTGEYFSQKEQKQKKSYLTIGKLFIYHDGGMSLKLDAMPMQNQSIQFYDIKPKNQPNQQQQHNNYSGGYQGN